MSRDGSLESRRSPVPLVWTASIQDSTHRQCAGVAALGAISRIALRPSVHAMANRLDMRSWRTLEMPPWSLYTTSTLVKDRPPVSEALDDNELRLQFLADVLSSSDRLSLVTRDGRSISRRTFHFWSTEDEVRFSEDAVPRASLSSEILVSIAPSNSAA
eukprot:3900386-Prymnesium_polylepis.1